MPACSRSSSISAQCPRCWCPVNATGVGRRKADGSVTLTRLFAMMMAHYGFEARFCNPYSGNEKGSVANAVGFVRRHLMVPLPAAESYHALGEAWLAQCDALASRVHYRKDQHLSDLFATDLEHMLALAASPFDPCDWRWLRADRTGTVTVGRDRFLAGPKWHGMRLEVGVRAMPCRTARPRGRTDPHVRPTLGYGRKDPDRTGQPLGAAGAQATFLAAKPDQESLPGCVVPCLTTWPTRTGGP